MSAEVEVTFLEPCADCTARLAEWVAGPTVIVPPALMPMVGRLAGVRRGRLTDQEYECGRRLVEVLNGVIADLLDGAGVEPTHAELLVIRPCRDCRALTNEYQGGGRLAIVAPVATLAGLVPLVRPERPALRRSDRESADRIASTFRRAHALLAAEQRRARVERLAAAQRAAEVAR